MKKMGNWRFFTFEFWKTPICCEIRKIGQRQLNVKIISAAGGTECASANFASFLVLFSSFWKKESFKKKRIGPFPFRSFTIPLNA